MQNFFRSIYLAKLFGKLQQQVLFYFMNTVRYDSFKLLEIGVEHSR